MDKEKKNEFKVLNSRLIAAKWGEAKTGDKSNDMTYEKFSRGIRYYNTGSKVISKVEEVHVFRFNCDIEKILGFDPTSDDGRTSVDEDWEDLKRYFGLCEHNDCSLASVMGVTCLH